MLSTQSNNEREMLIILIWLVHTVFVYLNTEAESTNISSCVLVKTVSNA